MSDYRLMAFDLDGTLLDPDKRIPADTGIAMQQAVEAGKAGAFCTGRNIVQTVMYSDALPQLRYSICCSGAILHDNSRGEILSVHPFTAEAIDTLLAAASAVDHFPLLMTPTHGVLTAGCDREITRFHLDDLRRLLFDAADRAESLSDWYRTPGRPPVCKINLYYLSAGDRERAYAALSALPFEMVRSDHYSLEFTMGGVTKAAGIAELCALTGCTMAQAIAIGDGENDLPALRAAGLGIAMGNAADSVRQEADVVVSDNAHGGCAEAIRKYLIGE